MIRLLLLVLLGSGLKAQATLDCGKYPTATTDQGQVCRRVGILPWFVGIPGQWETELRLGAGGDPVRFAYSPPASYNTNLMWIDYRAVLVAEGQELDLKPHASYLSRILAFGDYDAATVSFKARNATGSLDVRVDASSAAAINAASAFAVYKYIPNGSVVSQTTTPVIFLDQASVRWTAVITETPRDQQSQPDATITSFAVANLSANPQAVLIRVYNEFGELSASAKSRELQGGIGSGDVHADTLAHILGLNLPVSGASPSTFQGTIIFEGEKGGPIAPVVFRFNGSAVTTVPVRGE